jgi:hypothetical protein
MAIGNIVDLTSEQLQDLLAATTEEKHAEAATIAAKMGDTTFLESHIAFDDEMLNQIAATDEFSKGVKEAAEIAGFYTTLINFGMSVEFVETMIESRFVASEEGKITKAVLEYQAALAKDSNETQKALMKERSAQIESNQI